MLGNDDIAAIAVTLSLRQVVTKSTAASLLPAASHDPSIWMPDVRLAGIQNEGDGMLQEQRINTV